MIFLKEIVVLQKVSEKTLDKFGESLKRRCSGLEVRFIDIYKVNNDWVKIDIDGEDEIVAVNLLAKEIGLAPVSANNVSLFSVYRGRVVSLTESEDRLFIDIGVFSPKPTYAVIPLGILQGQLVDGKKFGFEKIRKLFGLIDGIPLEVQIVDIRDEIFKAVLTWEQIARFSNWIESYLDRLIVLEGTYEETLDATKRAKLLKDIVSVAYLGFLEQSIICKLGTVAVGLVRKLGRHLQNASFVCFSPLRIRKVMF